MSVSAAKSKAPIESAIVAPINESTTFTPGNTIIFRIGPSDMLYWLIQDSYFVFDVDWTYQSNTAGKPAIDLSQRNSSCFIDNVRLLHAGNEVYYCQYNQAQQFLDYVKSGDDYLKSQFNEWTCHSTLSDPNNANVNFPLILKPAEWVANAADTQQTNTKKGVIMHVSQILKCFSQIENFPLKYLTQQMEIRFQLSAPKNFVLANTATNFYEVNGNEAGAGTLKTTGGVSTDETAFSYAPLSYTIKNMRLYMFGAQVEPSYDAVESASNASGQGTVWKYQIPRVNLRNNPALEAGYYIANFQCITENTDDMYVWAIRGDNLGATIRPKITNCNLRFGPYQIPKSPIAEDNWTKPALYKALVDDTLEYSTAYYTSANRDLFRSYFILPATATNLGTSPHDTHILMAGSFTTDDGKPGSNSKAWNSQYNFHYQLLQPESPFTLVLAVDTDYVLTLRNGMLSSTNI